MGKKTKSKKTKKEKETKGPKNEIHTVLDKDASVGASLRMPDPKTSQIDLGGFQMKQSCSGDYALGMVLQDTLRVGRCINNEGTIKICPITYEGLHYRNSADAIDTAEITLKKMVGLDKQEDIGEDVEEPEQNPELEKKPKDQDENKDAGFLARMKNLVSLDENVGNVKYKQPVRKKSNIIQNHIHSFLFDAKFEAVCSGPDAKKRCKVVKLSYFDKYYNAFYTGTMVSSILGPTVIGMSKKTLSKMREFRIVNKPFGELAEGRAGKFFSRVKETLQQILPPSSY
jgi:hypothetical protein